MPPWTPPPIPAGAGVPVLTVPIQAYRVSDNAGLRPADITPEQVAWWVDQTNRVYAPAGIRFTFDPSRDFADLRDSALNDAVSPSDVAAPNEYRVGDLRSALLPAKLVVYFRHGPGEGPTGMAFASKDHNFVMMPGWAEGTCGHPDSGLLAHEIGHFLGLWHTFAATFPDIPAAETYAAARGNDPAGFDGDQLADTPPDPYITSNQCHPPTSILVGGVQMQLPAADVMSYYDGHDALTPQQVAIVRANLEARLKNGMKAPATPAQ